MRIRIGQFVELIRLKHKRDHVDVIVDKILLYVLSEQSRQSYYQGIRIKISYFALEYITVISVRMKTLCIYNGILVCSAGIFKHVYRRDKDQLTCTDLFNILIGFIDQCHILLGSIIRKIFFCAKSGIDKKIRICSECFFYILGIINSIEVSLFVYVASDKSRISHQSVHFYFLT